MSAWVLCAASNPGQLEEQQESLIRLHPAVELWGVGSLTFVSENEWMITPGDGECGLESSSLGHW